MAWKRGQIGKPSSRKAGFAGLQYNTTELESNGRIEPPSPKKMLSDKEIGSPSIRKEIQAFFTSKEVKKDFLKDMQPPSLKTTKQVKSFVPASKLPQAAYAKGGNGVGNSVGVYSHPPGMSYVSTTPSDWYSYQAYSQPYVMAQPYSPVFIPIMMPSTVPNVPALPVAPSDEPLFTGRVKFFDESLNYGFFILDCDGSDLFVHYDDFLQAGCTKDFIKKAKATNQRFAFQKIKYFGKYNESFKAVKIQLLEFKF